MKKNPRFACGFNSLRCQIHFDVSDDTLLMFFKDDQSQISHVHSAAHCVDTEQRECCETIFSLTKENLCADINAPKKNHGEAAQQKGGCDLLNLSREKL